MSTAIICILLLAICIFSVKSYMGKLKHGCCGSGGNEDTPKRIRVKDKDKSHYPYSVMVEVEGMTCSHCAVRVENALNTLEGTWAKVNLEKKSAYVRMKSRLTEETIKQAVRDAGYIAMHISCGGKD